MMRFASSRLFLALFVVALGGCGGTPVATDAAVPREDASQPMDAGPPDTGAPLVRCIGTPAPCATLPTASECSTIIGCAFSQCAGFAVVCDRNASEALCAAEMGCTWTGTECLGAARGCGTFSENEACQMQAGCTWSTLAQCRGTATACGSLPAGACLTQPGCEIDMTDAATEPDAGDEPDAGE